MSVRPPEVPYPEEKIPFISRDHWNLENPVHVMQEKRRSRNIAVFIAIFAAFVVAMILLIVFNVV